MAGTEPSTHICSNFEVCLTVDEQCNIQGSAQARYDSSTCAYTSPSGCMSYEVSCPDYDISVSGEMLTEALRIFVDGSQAWEQVTAHETCHTNTTMSMPGSMMQMAYGSATRNGGGYLCEIEARDGAHMEVTGVDAAVPENLGYTFSVDLYAGCSGH
jgi:hypothetical protein